ncbi:MAG: hypothetical protein HeimC2_21740 [Candidatus Heimdallarchaeota archaeon LC_2]|nr:MAG: hypothetical protein HeimC2_21740 [Candidatus Heimdallarchaeota archaeon LC_2]
MMLKLSGVVVFLNMISVTKFEFSVIWLFYSTVFLVLLIQSSEFNQIIDETDSGEITLGSINLFVYGTFQTLFFIYLVFDAYIWINL